MLCVVTVLVFKQPQEAATIITSSLQMRKLQHREVNEWAQGHMANEWARNQTQTQVTSAALLGIVCAVDLPGASLVLSCLPRTVGNEVVRGPSF